MKPGCIITAGGTRGDAGVGTDLIDSDQMGVPTRCCAATENSCTPSRCIPQEHIVHFIGRDLMSEENLKYSV